MLQIGWRLILLISITTAEDLFEQAHKRYEQKNAEYLKLYDKYHMTPDSFDSPVNTEFDPSVAPEIAAYNLLEFQYLVKEKGYCKKQTWQDCLNRYAESIPEEDKCHNTPNSCNENDKYSQIGGYCNNLLNPNYGRVRRAYKRLITNAYSDGIRGLRKSMSGSELKSARTIGNALDQVDQLIKSDRKTVVPNLAGLMLGQLITHDISNKHIYSIKGNGSPGIRCCAKDYSKPLEKKDINPNCVPVPVPSDDSFFANKSVRCLNFVRMAPTLDNNCAIVYEQVNDISSFLDLSIIYSDNKTRTNILRSHSGGLFQLNSENILPVDQNNFYIGGDLRLGQTPQLALQHSLFYRSHNYIAKKLAQMKPNMDDDTLFYESRRINIAVYQNIVYNEWLPLYLGTEICKSFKLICNRKTDHCDEYNANIDPSTSVEFGMNAFRFFHKNIPSTVEFVDGKGNLLNETALSDTIIRSSMLQDSYDNLLRGQLQQGISDDSAGYSSELRNKMFKRTFKGEEVGSDLFMLDLMRSRDSGTAPYIDYYDFCLSKKIRTWDDLKLYFDRDNLKLLQTLYEDVKDVDLLVGTFLEKHSKYKIGPIGGCLVAEQFQRLRFGDRFFFTHRNSPYKFTKEQLSEITKMTYTKLICMVTDLDEVPEKGLIKAKKNSDYVKCKYQKPINLKYFIEKYD